MNKIKHYIGLAQVALFVAYDNIKGHALKAADLLLTKLEKATAKPVNPGSLVILGVVVGGLMLALAAISVPLGVVAGMATLFGILHYLDSDYYTPDCDCGFYLGTAEEVVNERGLSVTRTPHLTETSAYYTWTVYNKENQGYGYTLDEALDNFEEDEFNSAKGL